MTRHFVPLSLGPGPWALGPARRAAATECGATGELRPQPGLLSGPGMGESHILLHLPALGRQAGADINWHCEVHPKRQLRLQHEAGAEMPAPTLYMVAEMHAVLAHCTA